MQPIACLLVACLLTVACEQAPGRQLPPLDSVRPRATELAAYSVSGRVSDISGRPLIAARIEVLAPGFEGLFATADAQGRYQIGNLVGGVRLEVSKGGFVAVSRGVSGPADAIVDFNLEPLSH
jgi:carboxypeptidase family protein